MVGRRFFVWLKGSGTVACPFLACHCFAPAGLFVSSHSFSNRFLKNRLLHFVGVCDQMTSGPPVIASRPIPVPCLLFQPSPWSSRAPLSGSGPTSDGSPAPCVLPKVCPPAIRATVSSSFIAIRKNVS